MQNARALLASLVAAALLLGACTSSPTSSLRPDAARLDAGGHGYGSGNVIASGDTTTPGAATSSDAVAPGDTVGRGGHGYGSGN